ncbi:MAG TPA: hypothetical protein VIY10_15545, partial [Solirubrobacteraceae bacterium]
MHDAAPPPTRTDDAPWRAPVRGGHPDPHLATGPGVDFLAAMLAGDTPAPPLSRLTGMRPVRFTPGCAEFAMPVSPWLCADDGRVPLG